MFKNYLKIALRNLIKFKTLSLINLTGLVVGVTVCLHMLVYVIHESSYESFHQNKERIYRIAVEWGTETTKIKMAGSMPALAPALNAQVPEVEKAIRVRPDYDAVIVDRAKEEFPEDHLFFSDPGIFDIFSFQLKQGNKDEALSEPFSIVLSESKAKKYFNTENALGQTLFYGKTPLKVTGVFKDLPSNTHLHCELLVSYSTLEATGHKVEQPWNSWGEDYTYVLLRKHASIQSLHRQLDALLLKNTGEWFAARMAFVIQPLSDIHWNAQLRGDIGPKGNRLYVYIFLSAAILVLLIASFNFMNLSTARYLDRLKEVGVRKVVGANRLHLINQFLCESFLTTSLAVLFGIGLFEVFASHFYAYLNTKILFDSIFLRQFGGLALGLLLLVTLFAGSYPALLLSRFQPIEILKGSFSSRSVRVSFRTFSVVTQFAISIFLVVGTLLIYRQLTFMKNSDLGFDKGGVVLLRFPLSNEEVKQRYEALENELLRIPNVISASGAYTVPGVSSQMNMGVQKQGDSSENSVSLQALPVDFEFIQSLGLELVQGRNFSPEHSLDREESVLLNQTAVKALGLKSPVGAKLKIPQKGEMQEMTVIGVVRDFPVQSLQNKIAPMLLYINPDMYIVMAVKFRPENTQQTLAAIEEVWHRMIPGEEFHYRFLQDAYNALYENEERAGQLLLIFAVLAIVISCLGLLGLATFVASGRFKEIGIRKVLGASVGNVVVLLSKDFVKLVLLANL
ncbi:MAG: ABC transporter permease, partial [bacterium]